VVNYAEQAFVSTQSVIRLLLRIQRGDIPDLVIFYDGINDVFAAYQSGAAGGPQNLEELAVRFAAPRRLPPLIELLSSTRTFPFFQRLVRGEQAERRLVTYRDHAIDAEALATAIVGTYAGNLELLEALAARYGFEYHCFWQPGGLFMESKPRTVEEESMRRVALGIYPGLVELMEAAYTKAQGLEERAPRFHWIADLFRDHRGFLYIDPWHLTVEGNRRIAAEILRRCGAGRPR
jgi:hypothetical protein